MSFLANVPRPGSIVVLGDPIFANVSRFGVVVVQGAEVAVNVLFKRELRKGPK